MQKFQPCYIYSSSTDCLRSKRGQAFSGIMYTAGAEQWQQRAISQGNRESGVIVTSFGRLLLKPRRLFIIALVHYWLLSTSQSYKTIMKEHTRKNVYKRMLKKEKWNRERGAGNVERRMAGELEAKQKAVHSLTFQKGQWTQPGVIKRERRP